MTDFHRTRDRFEISADPRRLDVDAVHAYRDLAGLRRFMLATRDAHGLYERCAFKPLATPQAIMEIVRMNPYIRDGVE